MDISVVIPTYKRADLLSKAIDSVLDQTFKNIEINVVSDGYDEATHTLMKEYKNNKKINYYYYTHNQGGNFARNYGIKHSNGKFIAFLDDDDRWAPTKLEKQYKIFLENPKIGLVYTGNENTYPELNISYLSLPTTTGDLSEKIFLNNYIGSTSSVMVRKSVLDKAGLFDEELPSMQDYELWLRICQETEVGVVSEPLLIYINENMNDQISANPVKKMEALNFITKKYSTTFTKHPEYKRALERRTLQNTLRIFQRNKDKKSLKTYTKEYLRKYKDLKAYIFVLTTKFPYKLLLKIRSLKFFNRK